MLIYHILFDGGFSNKCHFTIVYCIFTDKLVLLEQHHGENKEKYKPNTNTYFFIQIFYSKYLVLNYVRIIELHRMLHLQIYNRLQSKY